MVATYAAGTMPMAANGVRSGERGPGIDGRVPIPLLGLDDAIGGEDTLQVGDAISIHTVGETPDGSVEGFEVGGSEGGGSQLNLIEGAYGRSGGSTDC